MPYKIVPNDKIESKYKKYLENQNFNFDNLDNNYKEIRDFFLKNYYELKEEGNEKYQLDFKLGLAFYQFMNEQKDFNLIYESNYDFWKYIAVYVIPDIIADRFGIDKSDHFYTKGLRIYPYSIYWYINLSWQGSAEATYEILKDNTTDEILQLVERPSKIGINLDLYREIMRVFSTIPKKERYSKLDDKKIFILVLMKNRYKQDIFEPVLYPGGIKGYVKMLFEKYI